ncbi:hypothetical protein SAMN05421840_1284 [Shewanella morhuae]|uniref:virulence factor TspB C-terminal domain-related protein n=1 Tax=Shewanella morhuae TaxID=365591 RepID=UPI000955F5D4|nr:virulence factor TspB C-terminal domain-related protein [Shewanella morhuae]SIR46040.1 hypothetical protein SAMN05421840_1284 [Shewanella morhuae]
MVNRTFGDLGLHKAGFLLALFSFPLFAYSPPATPDLPLLFEFTGANAQAESRTFHKTRCDSNDYSWYGVSWFCAVGDPSNLVCVVEMAYHSTDVNNCQFHVPEEPPQFPIGTDSFSEGTGTTGNMASLIKSISESQWRQLADNNSLTRNLISSSNQSNNLLFNILGAMGETGDRQIVDAINTWGATNWNEMRSQFEQDNIFNLEQAASFKSVIQEEFGIVGRKLNYMHDTLYSIENKTGTGGGTGGTGGGTATDLSPLFPYLGEIRSNTGMINNSLGTLYSINGSMNGINNVINNSSASEQLLLKAINDSIKSLTSTPSDSVSDSVSSTGCASFQCSSDSPSCFIAKKEWERSCASSQSETDGNGLVDSLVSSVKEYNESPDSDIQNIDAGTINTDALLNKYTNANGFNAGGQQTCPAPLPLDIGIAVLHLDLSPMCDLAAVISWFVIATAMLSSGLAIAKYS